jgi:bacterioferritin
MESVKDYVSRDLFKGILADEEHHIDYLDTQLDILEKIGEALYIQSLIEQPEEA